MTTLRDLPFTEVKIERSFVSAMGRRRRGSHIVRSIVALARDLDLRVVAEGIERPSELAELAELGCDVGQGYLFCPPLPIQELDSWLRSHHEPGALHPSLPLAVPSDRVLPIERGAS